MSFRAWVFVTAVGLTILPGLGQSQEKTEEPQGGVTAGSGQPAGLPFAIPIEIIESASEAEARQRSEDEAEKREIADLAAQRGMHLATEAMNDATQKMAKYAFWSTLLVFVGTVLLFATLYLTRQANRAAQAAVDVTREVGIKQTRANLYYSTYIVSDPSGLAPGSGKDVGIELVFENYGPTPARDIAIEILDNREVLYSERDSSGYFPAPKFRDFDVSKVRGRIRRVCGPERTITSHTFSTSRGELESAFADRRFLYVAGWVRYKDDFWKSDTDYRYCKFCLIIQRDKDVPDLRTVPASNATIKLKEHGPDNYST
jgi:hypothetical protein